MTNQSQGSAVPPELRRLATWILLGALLLVAGISSYKYSAYKNEAKRRAAEAAAGPEVHLAVVKKGMGDHTVTVIGETRPFESATLYAKVSGYLKKVAVDKGDMVQEGQVLAIIESPETDEAYVAAEADAKNKKSILVRTRALYDKQLVSQQEFDQAQADSDVASAKLRAQQTLKGYEILRAPFRGTITARYADPGALVQNATSSDSGTLPVLMISEIRRLRVDIFIDQRDAPYVQKDDPVIITLQERPGFKLYGKVARVTDELDPRTKMLLTEIDIPNESLALVAGSFVQVTMQVKSPPYLEAPVEAMVLKDDKTFLTTIADDNTLSYKAVTVGSNDGKFLTIISGAQEGDRLAMNVGTALPEGSKVRPLPNPTPSPEPAAVASAVPVIATPSTSPVNSPVPRVSPTATPKTPGTPAPGAGI